MKHFTLVVICLYFLSGCSEQVEKRTIDSFHLTEEPVFSAEFSRDTQWVSLYTVSKTLEVWDIGTRTKKLSLPISSIGEVARAYTLASNKQLLFVAGEHRVSLWSVNDGRLVQYYNISGADPLARIASMAVAPNDQSLVLGMSDGSVVVMSFSDKQLHLFKPHNAEVAKLIWNNESTQVMSGGLDGLVVRWSSRDYKPLSEFSVSKRVTSLVVDPAFNTAFVSDSLSDQFLFDVETGEKQTSLHYSERFRWFRHGYLFEDLPYLVTTSSKTQLYIWDKVNGSLLKSYHIDAGDKEALIIDVALNHSTGIKTISSEGVIEYWDIANLALNK